MENWERGKLAVKALRCSTIHEQSTEKKKVSCRKQQKIKIKTNKQIKSVLP